MKTTTFLIFIIAMAFFSCGTEPAGKKQNTYKGLPLIKAKSSKADYRTGSEWVRGNWTISPHISSDSLIISLHDGNEEFAFYTDADSIVFKLTEQAESFYVCVNDTAYALTVIKGVRPELSVLKFDTLSKDNKKKFWYEQNNRNAYLDLLRSKYKMDSLITGAKTDTEKALKILSWVHKQWPHNGSNEPAKNDAISILEEAKTGKNFRCVEYGIVATACLNSIGLKARTLGLKTEDVETRQYGAGHVLLEVFLADLNKWCLLDGQWDAMPFLNNVPLNAVEFQKAISTNYNGLEIKSASGVSKRNYVDWIYPYLYYFDISFDNREGINIDPKKVEGKTQLMLVPLGVKEPAIFQVVNKIENCLYTHSLKDFYAAPENTFK